MNVDTHQLSYLEPSARARRSDPETSKAAARSVTRIRQSQRLILETLRAKGPLSDEEIYSALLAAGFFGNRPLSPSGARTRRKELVRLGYVESSSDRRKTAAGREAIVWRATLEAS